MAQIISDIQFLAQHFKWGVEDFNKLTWRMRKEIISFHIECLEEAERKKTVK